MEKTDNKSWFGRVHHLHYLYIIIILLIAIIAYVAYCHSSESAADKQLLAFLSFAATLSSIILSVLAIIITVLASHSTDRLSDSVAQLSQIPKEIDDQFAKSTESFKTAAESIQRTTEDNVKKTSENVDLLSELLSEKLSNLKIHIDSKFEGHEKQLEKLSKNIIGEASKGNSLGGKVKVVHSPAKELVESFMHSTSKATLLFLYLIKEYCKREISKPVSLSSFCTAVGFSFSDVSFPSYLYGAIIQLSSVHFIDYDTEAGNFDKIYFRSINDVVSSQLESIIDRIDNDVLKKTDRYLDEISTTPSDPNADNKE